MTLKTEILRIKSSRCYVNSQNTKMSLKQFNFIHKIKLILHPQVGNSTTQLTLIDIQPTSFDFFLFQLLRFPWQFQVHSISSSFWLLDDESRDLSQIEKKITVRKGQLRSERLFKVFICTKTERKHFCISALASKK